MTLVSDLDETDKKSEIENIFASKEIKERIARSDKWD